MELRPSSSYRTALVTGASRGLGRAMAEELARAGTTVAMISRGREQLDEVAANIRRSGGVARTFAVDVGDTEAAVQVIERIDDALGGLDLCIASAGVGPDPYARPHAWRSVAAPLNVNLCGAAATLTAVLPRMVDRRRGHIVGISSLASLTALPGSAAYCAPKAGLDMLLECLRLDVEPFGVAVTAVHAGFIDTGMVAHRTAPMPQLMAPADAARTIVAKLAARPRVVDLPQPLALATRAVAALPRPIREALLRRLAAR